jgi:osmotically-inducible protein OsmY
LWSALHRERRRAEPRSDGSPDERIRDRILQSLNAEPGLDPSDITVRVENGEVTLSGTVPNWASHYFAESLTGEVRGVNQVRNELRVRESAEAVAKVSPSPAIDGGRPAKDWRYGNVQ